MMNIFSKIYQYGQMVKFQHSIFALPFALAGVAFAAQERGVTFWQIFWIILAMVGARNAAMGFNRIADEKLDALNPRTVSWELPRKILKRWETVLFVIFLSALFIFSAYMLNDLCFYLSPLALFIIFFYSYTKRFTWFSQLFLGLSLSLAPAGAWIAIRGDITPVPIMISLGVIFWVAGFDTIYACQDYEFDKKMELFSIPQRFGIDRALLIAKLFHIVSVLFLVLVSWFITINPYIYFGGMIVILSILLYEHHIVKPHNLTKVNVAFFHMNAIISVIYLGTSIASILIP